MCVVSGGPRGRQSGEGRVGRRRLLRADDGEGWLQPPREGAGGEERRGEAQEQGQGTRLSCLRTVERLTCTALRKTFCVGMYFTGNHHIG
ncbi:Protein of unknown function [Gryllus bimaculatus]|nr:Protein of unknown function [Gryllus bimaculatus]